MGEKRVRKSAKKSLAEDEDEDEEEPSGMNEEDDEDEDKPSKKRKVGAGKAEKAPKPKKGPKRPTEFKKGKWNPFIEVFQKDKYKEEDKENLFLDCCIRCNNRNIIRASVLGNAELLKAGIQAKDKISQLTAYWSPDCNITSLDLIIG